MADENCSRCGYLMGQVINSGRDETFDPAFVALERREQFRRCPDCGTWFKWTDRPQLYGSGNLDEQEYERFSAAMSALLEPLLPVDPKNPPSIGAVARFFEGLPLPLLLEALEVNEYRGPKVVQPFVPELARRLVETGNHEMHDVLRAYAYQSKERSAELRGVLDALPPAGKGSAQVRELIERCAKNLA